MTGVMKNFCIASMFMWVAPVAILYGFKHSIFPGSAQLSSYYMTLVSGFLAVVSVNVVIILYIYMAMKEQTSDKHESDSKFLAQAQASVIRDRSNGTKEGSSSTRLKHE